MNILSLPAQSHSQIMTAGNDEIMECLQEPNNTTLLCSLVVIVAQQKFLMNARQLVHGKAQSQSPIFMVRRRRRQRIHHAAHGAQDVGGILHDKEILQLTRDTLGGNKEIPFHALARLGGPAQRHYHAGANFNRLAGNILRCSSRMMMMTLFVLG